MRTIPHIPRILAIAMVAAATLALGCIDTDYLDNPNDPNKTDGDKDGVYKEDGDCNDEADQVYPNAPERLNCKDDDCDKRVDEGVPYNDGVNTTNEDRDGDGFCPSTGDKKDCEGDKKRNPFVAEDGGDQSGQPNGIDDNCNGIVDEGLSASDVDKDGFTVGDGDCNDNDPNVSPGAVEVPGMACNTGTDCPPPNKCYDGYCRCISDQDCSSLTKCREDSDCKKWPGEKCKGEVCTSKWLCMKAPTGMGTPQLMVCRDNADNDCDNKVDEMPTRCDDPAKLSKDKAGDMAKAIELCDTDLTCGVEKSCPGKMLCANGKCSRILKAWYSTKSVSKARAISTRFAKSGPFVPKAGKAFAVLSSGLADYDPKVKCPQQGTEFGHKGTDPDPKATKKNANDMIQLGLQILVPSNARSFDFDFNFFSTEYPEWVGSKYNDTFWVALSSKKFNGNISFDSKNVPIRINNAFFSICDPYPPKPATKAMCTKTPASKYLTGTGYAKDCSGFTSIANGGATDWLRTTSPVTPGETITLVFSIFDKGDHVLDSTVLIDNFRWKLSPAAAPTTKPQ